MHARGTATNTRSASSPYGQCCAWEWCTRAREIPRSVNWLGDTLLPTMLFCRECESMQIDDALDAARERRSGALVIRGEAGIGKCAIFNAAIECVSHLR